jgi:hypothetical protein
MNRILVIVVAALSLNIGIGSMNIAESGSVRGYYKSDGTYVQRYSRSSPDRRPYNNYGYPGNYNPNTGSFSRGSSETYIDRYYSRESNRRSYSSPYRIR